MQQAEVEHMSVVYYIYTSDMRGAIRTFNVLNQVWIQLMLQRSDCTASSSVRSSVDVILCMV
jgi:hypothetical protein